MGTTLSVPQSHFFVTKPSHDSNTLPSSQDDDDGHNDTNVRRSNSPALIGREVLATLENDDAALANPSRMSLDESDKKVLVNIEMGDLMAYLQVVANHSSNLPQTKRDDPGGDVSVSIVPDDIYAKKSAAFIPSNIRIIGASCLKYGRVWDLPNVSEYNPFTSAQEPGRSYGGAICNAMLKVLYDNAANAAGAETNFGAHDGLFDDDEQSYANMSRCSVTGSISMNEHCSLSWADLLWKMNTEITDLDFNQVPTLTTSRLFDVHEEFSIVPDTFNPNQAMKRCLLIGCNYKGPAELKASHDDIRSMKDYIVTVHGFSEDEDLMTVLLDDGEHDPPTYFNIIESFKRISEQSQPGDVVFIQFSGHGSRLIGSRNSDQVETYDEVIIPCDYEESGPIRDTLIFKTLLAPMRFGVTATILIDSCDTGMMLDLPYAWSTRSDSRGALTSMTQNEDFSFVRFLKVVKTLYESSIFAQLGNRVDELIENQPEPSGTKSAIGRSTHRTDVGEDNNISLNVNESVIAVESFPGQQLDMCCAPSKLSQLGQADSQDLQQDPANTSFMDRLADCALGHEFDDESRVFNEGYVGRHSERERGRPSKNERSQSERSGSRSRRSKSKGRRRSKSRDRRRSCSRGRGGPQRRLSTHSRS